MIDEALLTLKSLDIQHDAELEQLEKSGIDEELKNDIRAKLLAKHRERREPVCRASDRVAETPHNVLVVAQTFLHEIEFRSSGFPFCPYGKPALRAPLAGASFCKATACYGLC
jgi:hypothetical protein